MKVKTKWRGKTVRIVLMVFCQIGLASADMAYGKMAAAPSKETSAKSVQEHFEKLSKTRELTDQEKETLSLTKFSQVLGMVNLPTYQENDPSGVQSWNLQKALLGQLQHMDLWERQLSPQKVDVLNQEAATARNVFGQDSYISALILFQNGKSAEAKNMLVKEFDQRSNAILQSTEQAFMHNPLSYLTSLREALSKLGGTKELEEIDRKLQKVKIHYSNLPSSNIKT